MAIVSISNWRSIVSSTGGWRSGWFSWRDITRTLEESFITLCQTLPAVAPSQIGGGKKKLMKLLQWCSTSVMAEQRNWKSCVLNFQALVLPKQIIWFAASVSARLHLWILAFRRWCTQEDVSPVKWYMFISKKYTILGQTTPTISGYNTNTLLLSIHTSLKKLAIYLLLFTGMVQCQSPWLQLACLDQRL